MPESGKPYLKVNVETVAARDAQVSGNIFDFWIRQLR